MEKCQHVWAFCKDYNGLGWLELDPAWKLEDNDIPFTFCPLCGERLRDESR